VTTPGRLDASTIDLLGVLAYGELAAFERLAADARMAPTIGDKAALSEMAAQEFAHFVSLRDHLRDNGVDPESAMTPFVKTFDDFHDSTSPNDWLEGLIKLYVGDGLASDFYREVTAWLSDEPTKALILSTLEDTGHVAFAVQRVNEEIAADPAIGGRLALWGRRLMGEALIQAQRVAVERDALTELLMGRGDLAGITGLLSRLTDAHTARMAAIGLES
jgi:hypothetical protein